MIIDAHCHVVPTADGAAVTSQRMQEARVDHAVVVPGGMIPALGLADFLRGKQGLQEKSANNPFVLNLARESPRHISAFYQFDPGFDDVEDAELALSDGFVGFKLNPLVDRIAYGNPVLDDLFNLAIRRTVPIYTHVVLTGDASLEALVRLLERHSDVHLILGHMGFATADGEAIATAFRFPNMMLETSVGAFHAIKEAHKRLGSKKIVYGSEGPAHHPAVELRKIELLHLASDEFEDITFHNIARYLPAFRGA